MGVTKEDVESSLTSVMNPSHLVILYPFIFLFIFLCSLFGFLETPGEKNICYLFLVQVFPRFLVAKQR